MRRERDTLGRLYVEYAEANERHFAGLLPSLPIRIEQIGKFRNRRAEVETLCYLWCDDYLGVPRYLVFDRAHVLNAAWSVLRDDLLHEMVHVLQAVRGEKDGCHGATFKAMAKRLGISERAVD